MSQEYGFARITHNSVDGLNNVNFILIRFFGVF